ncbi:MAG TPA: hypothetical protein VK588_02145 [Chitinophagaceae bacterium]|nr:hypothetical protein [Chitinophagaceae bacterium]
MSLLVIAHIYYSSNWEYLFDRLLNLNKYQCTYIFNLVNLQYDKKPILESISKNFPAAIVLNCSNHGRDIGGKLAGIDLSLKLNIPSDFTLIIHDKQSPHASTGLNWRNELFRIIENNELPTIFSIFEKNAKAGVIGSKKFLMTEYDFSTQRFKSFSEEILNKLIVEMNLKITNHQFIAGNVFWVRSAIIRNFFSKFSPLQIRAKLEHGNALDFHKGTQIHSWERIFSWLANIYDYEIVGI